MWRKKSKREAEILAKQERERQQLATIVGVVEELRRKEKWHEKIADPDIRAKFINESITQGVDEVDMIHALVILDALSTCRVNSGESKNSGTSVTSEQAEDIAVKVRVGDTTFVTTTGVLTADEDCMLSRMFLAPWFVAEEGKVVDIHTSTNSAEIFGHILAYLEALKNDVPNIFPTANSFTAEDLETLHLDCDYLGIFRLPIAAELHLFKERETTKKRQMESSSNLSVAKKAFTALEKEKKKLEARLVELPGLIESAQNTLTNALAERELSVSVREAKLGDEIMTNHVNTGTYDTYGSVWSKCSVIEKDGNLMALSHMRYNLIENGSLIENASPLPPRTHYCIDGNNLKSSFGDNYGIVQCDGILPDLLAVSLEHKLDALLHQSAIDIHPGSSCQVVDLIHPSMFPYIKGVTAVSEDVLAACATIDEDYAWLPAEFEISADGFVKIASYINNLDEEVGSRLYHDIGATFQTMLPLFERVLKRDLSSRTLQVIVKAAYYIIAPGDVYKGSWHIEGMEHEHIVASGIYYVNVTDNIKHNKLSFRAQLSSDYYYSDNDRSDGHRAGEEAELIEELGYVETPAKRTIVWDNDYQHKVSKLTVPISNSTSACGGDRAGVRKILCFFLVDPNERVVSTSMVPRQQGVLPLNEAKAHRQKLMNKRKYIADNITSMWEERSFTFCEH